MGPLPHAGRGRDLRRTAWAPGPERSVGCSESRERNPERRARHVVKADVVAEVHRRRVAAVLPADPELEGLPDAPAPLARPPDQPADAGLAEGLERDGRNELL